MPPHPGVTPASGRLTSGGSEAMSGAPAGLLAPSVSRGNSPSSSTMSRNAKVQASCEFD